MNRIFLFLCLSSLWLQIADSKIRWFSHDDKDSSSSRRRLLDIPTADAKNAPMYDDAATGTVLSDPPAPQMANAIANANAASASSSSDCDKNLVQALAKAGVAETVASNERDAALEAKAKAEEKIQQLEQSMTDIQKENLRLQVKAEEALQQRNDSLDAAYKEREGALADLRRSKDDRIALLEKQIVELNDNAEKEKQEALTNLEQAKEEIIAKLEQQIQILVAENSAALSALQQSKDARIASLEKQLTVTRGEAEQEMAVQLATVEEQAKTMEIELKLKLEKAQADHAAALKINQEKAERVLQEKASALKQQLKEAQEEADRVLQEQVSALKQQLQEAQEKSKASLASKNRELEEVKTQNKRVNKEKSEISKQQQQVEKELNHFKAVFDNRGYCNMTYVKEDLHEKAKHAYAETRKALDVAVMHTKETLEVQSRKLVKEISLHSKIAYDRVSALSKEQFDQHWPKVKPHYDQHVAPLVEKGQQWKSKELDPRVKHVKEEYAKLKKQTIDPKMEVLHQEWKKLFIRMVNSYKFYCNEGYEMTLDVAKKRDKMEYFLKVGPAMKTSCQNPELSVTVLLRVLLILILLPFVGRIYNLVLGILGLVWKIFLTVTLLRFILPSRVVPKEKAPAKYQKGTFPKGRKLRSHAQ